MLLHSLLFISDPPNAQASAALQALRIPFHVCSNGADAVKRLRKGDGSDVILSDLTAGENVELLASLRNERARALVIAMVDPQPAALVTELLEAGAADIVMRPLALQELAVALSRISRQRVMRDELERSRLAARTGVDEIIGRSTHIAEIMKSIERFAAGTEPLLISGEAGSGRNLIATTLHTRSPRARAGFARIDCSALPGPLLERELFGQQHPNTHAPSIDGPGGAGFITGALEQTQGGTLVLNRVEQMPMELQSRLLAAIGGRRRDVRLICITTEDLQQRAQQALFNEGLCQRLSGAQIKTEPLRKRGNDAVLIGDYIFRRYCAELGIPPAPLSDACWAGIAAYPWPGNVRELRCCMERAACMLAASKPVTVESLGISAGGPPRASLRTFDLNAEMEIHTPATYGGGPLAAVRAQEAQHVLNRESATFKIGDSLANVELEMIRRTLEKVGGNRTRAARILGISVRSLYSKIQLIEGRTSAAPASPTISNAPKQTPSSGQLISV